MAMMFCVGADFWSGSLISLMKVPGPESNHDGSSCSYIIPKSKADCTAATSPRLVPDLEVAANQIAMR